MQLVGLHPEVPGSRVDPYPEALGVGAQSRKHAGEGAGNRTTQTRSGCPEVLGSESKLTYPSARPQRVTSRCLRAAMKERVAALA